MEAKDFFFFNFTTESLLNGKKDDQLNHKYITININLREIYVSNANVNFQFKRAYLATITMLKTVPSRLDRYFQNF